MACALIRYSKLACTLRQIAYMFYRCTKHYCDMPSFGKFKYPGLKIYVQNINRIKLIDRRTGSGVRFTQIIWTRWLINCED
jgi:hypothetical protein